MGKKIIALILMTSILLTSCDEVTADAGQEQKGEGFTFSEEDSNKDWWGNYKGKDVILTVWVDNKTGVNYIVAYNEDAKDNEQIVITPRYNADGSLYTSEVLAEE